MFGKLCYISRDKFVFRTMLCLGRQICVLKDYILPEKVKLCFKRFFCASRGGFISQKIMLCLEKRILGRLCCVWGGVLYLERYKIMSCLKMRISISEDYVVSSQGEFVSQKNMLCLKKRICVSEDYVEFRKANLCLRRLLWLGRQIYVSRSHVVVQWY